VNHNISVSLHSASRVLEDFTQQLVLSSLFAMPWSGSWSHCIALPLQVGSDINSYEENMESGTKSPLGHDL
jgi:hypothetical protein